MTPKDVKDQIDDVISRLIRSSVSVKQFHPKYEMAADGAIRIGERAGTSIALRDIPYDVVYQDLDQNDSYHVKLVDGALLPFQYKFSGSGELIGHRLCYFPCPSLPTVEEAPSLYERDELYGDIIVRRLVRFPIRFDYAPALRSAVFHPSSHLTLGQYENCRIPVAGPMAPSSFSLFILRNFYFRVYKKFMNVFEKHGKKIGFLETIEASERRITHVVNGY